MRHALWGMVVVAAALAAGCGQSPDGAAPRIAVSTSYLEAVVRDLLGRRTDVVRLSGPGTCPGHFDITPAHVARLRRCRLLLRFDFQRQFDAKLQGAVDEGLRIVEVPETSNLCEPATYLAACKVAANALVGAGFIAQAAADARLGQIGDRLAALGEVVRTDVRSAGLEGAAVVAAHHQGRFCTWLGLEVAAEFPASDDPGALARVVAAGRARGVGLVIGNVPQGRVVADRLAEALDATVVLFDNFPPAGADGGGFDGMVRENAKRLLTARGQP